MGNIIVDSPIVWSKEHRAVQEVMEWWELWLAKIVILNAFVKLSRWIEDMRRSIGAHPARLHCVKL